MAKYQLVITADWNDADYLTAITPVTEAKLKKLKPIIKKIKNNNGDWDRMKTFNILTEEEYDFFFGYLPGGYPDGCDIHHIEEMYLQEIAKNKKLF